ncbi:hypothetical protein SAMN04487866_10464 [Thermoactinomyces sp. DSM 45891]|nr:hypothetical protein SAMN04487866_10464 [Thermoactinomyces sp. DSM 45891]
MWRKRLRERYSLISSLGVTAVFLFSIFTYIFPKYKDFLGAFTISVFVIVLIMYIITRKNPENDK